jgi:hypothetical protein
MGTLSEDQNHLWSYVAEFFAEWESFQPKVVEKIKTNLFLVIFFPENVTFNEDDVVKYGIA